jgi:Tfp pilus assembly protein PilX
MIRRLRDSVRRPPASRRGSVMVMVLACMAVAAAIATTMLRSATTSHRSLRTERDLRQVECLLVAAARIAQSRSASADAADDTILIDSSDLVGSGSARITFARDRATSTPAVRIVVEYPLEGPLTIRRSRSIALSPLPSSTTPEDFPR